ncbi:MAG TPA: hypothetical protein VFJ85_10580 [Acidimicrobiales bacterium]|nr:hypothetical protein [Acidimicrobiales bacterium]
MAPPARSLPPEPPARPGDDAGREQSPGPRAARRPNLPAAPAATPATRPDGRPARRVRRTDVPAGPAAKPVPLADDRPVRPPPAPAPRRRRVGLAAEAEAHQGRLRGGAAAAAAPIVDAPSVGTCACGMPASSRCDDGCGRPACREHLLQRSSHLAWPGPYRSEREHTAYMRGFWAHPGARCAWCRQQAGVDAMAALPPVEPLPPGVVERLTVLLRSPHDYPSDAWEQTIRQHGGVTAVAELLAGGVHSRKPAQAFDGRKGEVLAGVSVGSPGAEAFEVMDRLGVVWVVRPLGVGLVRKRKAWAWERAGDDEVARLLPRIVELAAR